jgi:hypothetical protein
MQKKSPPCSVIAKHEAIQENKEEFLIMAGLLRKLAMTEAVSHFPLTLPPGKEKSTGEGGLGVCIFGRFESFSQQLCLFSYPINNFRTSG